MLKLTIDQNSITRELGFDLRFHTPISYEEFCDNPEYENVIDEESRTLIIAYLTIRSFGSGWEIDRLMPYETIFSLFLRSNYIETYSNILGEDSLYSIFNEEAVKEINQGIVQDKDALNFSISIIKHYITDNNFFYFYENGKLRKQTKLLLPYLVEKIINYDGERYRKDRKRIKKNIQYSQTKKENKVALYLLFISIITDIELFTVIDPRKQTYIITDKDNLAKYTDTYFLCINIKTNIDYIISSTSSDYIQSIKDKYKHLKGDKTIRVFQDLQEAIKTNANLKIKLNVNKGDISYVDTEFRDQDLSKYHYLKNMISNSDTSHISIENHKGKPSAVVGHTRKRYDK